MKKVWISLKFRGGASCHLRVYCRIVMIWIVTVKEYKTNLDYFKTKFNSFIGLTPGQDHICCFIYFIFLAGSTDKADEGLAVSDQHPFGLVRPDSLHRIRTIAISVSASSGPADSIHQRSKLVHTVRGYSNNMWHFIVN
jgi:hypothetical protein